MNREYNYWEEIYNAYGKQKNGCVITVDIPFIITLTFVLNAVAL